ncbi:stalk domain-containing protein [Lutispora sp.]|jgi:hypothetical protein|uniref:stalk domain-containing protein n=1 Tax=Lutispora sp. TaxID=2828727 RepID=UPI003569A5CB
MEDKDEETICNIFSINHGSDNECIYSFCSIIADIDHFGGSKWDVLNAVTRTNDGGYVAVGNPPLEMMIWKGSIEAKHNMSNVMVNGVPISVNAYSINGNNYFKLRDVASAMNFGVGWDGTTNTITINTNVGYTN